MLIWGPSAKDAQSGCESVQLAARPENDLVDITLLPGWLQSLGPLILVRVLIFETNAKRALITPDHSNQQMIATIVRVIKKQFGYQTG